MVSRTIILPNLELLTFVIVFPGLLYSLKQSVIAPGATLRRITRHTSMGSGEEFPGGDGELLSDVELGPGGDRGVTNPFGGVSVEPKL